VIGPSISIEGMIVAEVLMSSSLFIKSLLLHVPTRKMSNLLDTYIEYIEEASFYGLTMQSSTLENYYDVPPLSKDGYSETGSLQSVITKIMTHNTSHTKIKHMKCSES
jgi:hypothetical protein